MSAPIRIDSKGYGKIYKAVMRDRNLPLLAKTIYAYFCAYAGCGCKAFPKRDKIVRDLPLEKELTDVLLFENVAARGFGTVPKLVMLDQNLTAQAKAIYAYFSSFVGAGTTAFPRRTTIMREPTIGKQKSSCAPSPLELEQYHFVFRNK